MHSRPRKLLRQLFGSHGRAPQSRAQRIIIGEASMATISKRSVMIAGHKTSVSLEEAFWSALKEIALRQGQSVSALVNRIQDERHDGNLSSAIRMFVLKDVRAHAAQDLMPPQIGRSEFEEGSEAAE